MSEAMPTNPTTDAIDAFLTDPSTGTQRHRPVRVWRVANNMPNAKTTPHDSLLDAITHAMSLLSRAHGCDEVVLTAPNGRDEYKIRRLL